MARQRNPTTNMIGKNETIKDKADAKSIRFNEQTIRLWLA
jgi:hypothetical protein